MEKVNLLKYNFLQQIKFVSLLFLVNILSTSNIFADNQIFTKNGIKYEYSYNNNDGNETLTVIDWESTIIDLEIPEGIDLPDEVNMPETDAST